MIHALAEQVLDVEYSLPNGAPDPPFLKALNLGHARPRGVSVVSTKSSGENISGLLYQRALDVGPERYVHAT